MTAPDRLGPLQRLHKELGMIAVRLADLRRPQVNLGVRLIALDDARRVFLVRHSYLPGWHLPGGAVDPEETLREAAVREAHEEGGLVFQGRPRLVNVYRSDSGRRDHIALFLVEGARQDRPRRPGAEIVASGFHALDALPKGVTAATRARLAELAEGREPDDVW